VNPFDDLAYFGVIGVNKENALLGGVQKKELQILEEVVAIFERHGLKYYLYGGTLIGAVRHAGFIPWDDDIDIAMPRDDYERFLEIARTELPEQLFIQQPATDKGYYLLFTKVRDNASTFIEPGDRNIKMHQGIYIDIFPLDAASGNKLLQGIHITVVGALWRLYMAKKYTYAPGHSKLRKMKNFLYKLLPVSSGSIIRLGKWIIEKGKSRKGKYLADFMLTPSRKRIYKSEWFKRTEKFEFEGRLYDGPAGYHEYLTHYYGDYMQLPSEEKRKQLHYEVCDPYKSYKELLGE